LVGGEQLVGGERLDGVFHFSPHHHTPYTSKQQFRTRRRKLLFGGGEFSVFDFSKKGVFSVFSFFHFEK
jgi:hypothetical protein